MCEKSAVLLLFVSKYNKDSDEKFYISENAEKKYCGTQTNDAPVRYLYDQSVRDGNPIRKVMYIASYEVVYGDKQQTAIKNLKNILTKAAEENGNDDPEMVEIPYDISEQGKRLEKKAEAQKSVCTHLMKSIEEITNGGKNECKVYIDYTGGLRDIAFLMTSVIKYLEFSCGSGVKIVYSELGKKDGTIYSLDQIYKLYRLINGVQEFANSGKATELYRYFEEGEPEEKKIVESMLDFSDAISLCDSNRIKKTMDMLNDQIEEFESRKSEGFNSVMLAALLPYVREKLFLDERGKVTFERLIKWCLKNRYIQQAVTLYVERVPQELFEGGVLADFNRLMETRHLAAVMDQKKKDPSEAEIFYTAVYKVFDSHDEVITTIKGIIDRLSEVASSGGEVRTAVEREINKEKVNQSTEIVVILDRLKNTYINKAYFDAYGKRTQAVLKFNDEDMNVKKLDGFLNEVRSKNDKLLFLITGEKTTNGENSSNEKNNTFVKKTEALENMKKWTGDDTIQKLRDVMAYYLALKIRRNRMNHAAETESQSEDEEKALEYLNKEGYAVSTEHDTATQKLECIRSVIEKGLEANRKFKEILGCQEN